MFFLFLAAGRCRRFCAIRSPEEGEEGEEVLPFGLPGQPDPSTRIRPPVGVLTAASAHSTLGGWNCLPVLSPSPLLSVTGRASRYGELTLHLVSTRGAHCPAGSSGPPVACYSGCSCSSSSLRVFPNASFRVKARACAAAHSHATPRRREGGGSGSESENSPTCYQERGTLPTLPPPAAPPSLRASGPAAAPCSPLRTPNTTPHTRRCCK